jgi:hypothetical protein
VKKFGRRGVSFVSITQKFNTTTSMGRLTLNVLLSFAQFEREVIGERVRDKIAASKKKGMWMGGMPPLGYDVKDRKLAVNNDEARTVVGIYRRYLGLKSVHTLKDELAEAGIKSKRRIRPDGSEYGCQQLSRGALYLMLQNRIYRGEITHKGNSFPGEHQLGCRCAAHPRRTRWRRFISHQGSKDLHHLPASTTSPRTSSISYWRGWDGSRLWSLGASIDPLKFNIDKSGLRVFLAEG